MAIEAEHCSETRLPERLRGAAQPIVVQAAKIDPLLEVNRALTGRRQRTLPVVMGIQRDVAPRVHNLACLDDSGLGLGSSHDLNPRAGAELLRRPLCISACSPVE